MIMPEVITLNQLSLVISQAAAPAFLLGAVASFLSVLVSHMSRIIDRSRAINLTPDSDPGKARLSATLPQLKSRAHLVNRAIYWAVASGISTCLLMIAAFGSAYFGIRHEPGAAILFTLSLGLFTLSLISFAREVRVAMANPEFG
jgi:uncharacterized protein DUF2721